MNKELEILNIIDTNTKVSQRELSKRLDISLGTVNSLVQKLISCGYLELIQLEARAVIYKITDIGYLKKAEYTYYEVLNSYAVITEFKKVIRDKLEALINNGLTKFYLYGTEDDVFRLIKMAILELKRSHSIDYVMLNELINVNDKDGIIVLWNPNIIEDNTVAFDDYIYILN